MKKFITCAILVLAVASQAYGFGHHGGHSNPPRGVYTSGIVAANPSNETGANGNNPVSMPEPETLLFLGAGLLALYWLSRKVKKN